MNDRVNVVAMIGSSVPLALRVRGRKVCWVLLIDGQRQGSAFATRAQAQACRNAWLAQMTKAA